MKTLALLLGSLLMLTVTGCNTQEIEVEVMEEEHMDEDMMMEMPDALSEEDAEKYQADLALDERIELANEVTMLMPLNGVDYIRTMFPDLEEVEEISNDDERNMMKMGPESLLYSAEGDFTIQICNEANSPIHLFEGSDLTDADFEEAMIMMEEMMHDGDM
jgi:hypothetical protein